MINKHLRSRFTKSGTKLVGSTTPYWAQNTAKNPLKGTPFTYFFKLHLTLLCLIAVEFVGHLCHKK